MVCVAEIIFKSVRGCEILCEIESWSNGCEGSVGRVVEGLGRY